jgi:hypothetical protein
MTKKEMFPRRTTTAVAAAAATARQGKVVTEEAAGGVRLRLLIQRDGFLCGGQKRAETGRNGRKRRSTSSFHGCVCPLGLPVLATGRF